MPGRSFTGSLLLMSSLKILSRLNVILELFIGLVFISVLDIYVQQQTNKIDTTEEYIFIIYCDCLSLLLDINLVLY